MNERLNALLAPRTLGRRRFLGLGAAALALPFASRLRAVAACPSPPLPPDRRLSFFNIHSGESASAAYCRAGVLVPEALARINYILRDTFTNEIKEIDVALLDLLVRLALAVSTQGPFHVISGYRSPSTNEYLRRHSRGGVVEHSLHLDGKAVDIRVPGIELRRLYRAAVDLRGGGVGFYAGEDFIHVDTGRVRTW